MVLQRRPPLSVGADPVFAAFAAVIEMTVRPASSSKALMTISSE
jgi:hypothetical protein